MIGRYRITGRIGSGSFATVYRGQDESLDVPVAVKVLADNWATNEDVRARFLAEARLLRRLSDERIVRVYDIGTTERGQPYFVMDLANGGSLEQLRKRMVAPGLALRLCAEAARALEVLHRNHLVHRDITPGNILLTNTPNGVRVMLADLGVAKSLLDEYRDTMTAGTPAYMALEQANSSQVDQRSDIYALACVTYALLTGKPPFPVKTLAELLSRDHTIGPAPIADHLGAPDALDQLMSAALSPDPNRRPQTAAQFADALDRLADVLPGGESYQPRPITSITTTPAVGQLPSLPASGRRLPARRALQPTNGYAAGSAVKKATDTHSPWFYVWVTGSAVLLLALTAWLTIYVLTR
ncbi:MAG: serine/threonine-protein kinase [Propionibacteriaceae bacterium]|nr:serine/threonine-protein kinase [Propionibacteriaceae bacterium]